VSERSAVVVTVELAPVSLCCRPARAAPSVVQLRCCFPLLAHAPAF
jgi:hypothetical protein